MYIDITRTIGFDTLTYPGDRPHKIETATSMKKGDGWNSLNITITSHTGTHIDAPFHLINNGKKLNEFGFENFILNCQVIEILSDNSISLNEIKKYKIKKNTAVLFKTNNSEKNRKKFDKKYIFLEKEAAEFLKNKKIKLVGIDYLSIDSFLEKTTSAHLVLLGNDILILEDINLFGVKSGNYKLFCFPLKLNNPDGAPCRCVLEQK